MLIFLEGWRLPSFGGTSAAIEQLRGRGRKGRNGRFVPPSGGAAAVGRSRPAKGWILSDRGWPEPRKRGLQYLSFHLSATSLAPRPLHGAPSTAATRRRDHADASIRDFLSTPPAAHDHPRYPPSAPPARRPSSSFTPSRKSATRWLHRQWRAMYHATVTISRPQPSADFGPSAPAVSF